MLSLAVCFIKTLLSTNKSTRRHDPEEQNRYLYRRENLKSKKKYVTFQVLTVAIMKMAVFWVVAPCSLVEHKDDG
jgi:hypothetical protein